MAQRKDQPRRGGRGTNQYAVRGLPSDLQGELQLHDRLAAVAELGSRHHRAFTSRDGDARLVAMLAEPDGEDQVRAVYPETYASAVINGNPSVLADAQGRAPLDDEELAEALVRPDQEDSNPTLSQKIQAGIVVANRDQGMRNEVLKRITENVEAANNRFMARFAF